MVLSARHVNKKDQEAKDLSKTSIVDDNDNETRGQLNFPVQQAIGQQNWESVSIKAVTCRIIMQLYLTNEA